MRTALLGFVLGLLSIAPGSGQAALVTERWTGEVATVANLSTFAIGEVVTWTITYDPMSNQQMTIYSDGANDRSDRGGADDSVETLFCLDPTSDPPCSAGTTAADGFSSLHDSTSDLSSIHARMKDSLLAGERTFDYWSTNRDNRTFRDVPWGVLEQFDYWSDDFKASADNYPYRCVYDCPNSGDAVFQLSYMDMADQLQFARLALTHVTHTTVPSSAVPLPPTAALVLLGFAFLGCKPYRFPLAKGTFSTKS